MADSANPHFGVIDRSMALRLDRSEASAFLALYGGKQNEFLQQFSDCVIVSNKVRNRLDLLRFKGQVQGKVALAYMGQRLSGEQDDFVLLSNTLLEFSRLHLDVPLKYRLMIRNVKAFQELQRKYSSQREAN
jgi:hypothetical protein